MPSQPSVGVDVPPFMPNYQWLLSLAADHCMSASGLRLSVVCLPIVHILAFVSHLVSSDHLNS